MNSINEILRVEESDAGVRLDRFVTDALEDLGYSVSRSQVQGWLQNENIQGAKIKLKASDNVTTGDEFQVAVPADDDIVIEPDDIAFDIIYEDEHLVVVNKPRGVVVHPAAGHPRNTLLNGLVARGIKLSTLGGSMRPGVVHRIDKDTSGVLMLAKTDLGYHQLAAQLKEHTVDRIYRAIVHGRVSHDSGLIDAPIGRDVRNRQRMAVADNGKNAITHFYVLDRYTDYTYLELKLETGRTHQIRVHMSYIEHPLSGDKVYGRRHSLPIDGQALHAMTLGFNHPETGVYMRFEAPVPEDMQKLVDGLAAGLYT